MPSKIKPLNSSFHKSLLPTTLTFLLSVKFQCTMCCKHITVRKGRGTEAKTVYHMNMTQKQGTVVMAFVASWPLLSVHHKQDELRQNRLSQVGRFPWRGNPLEVGYAYFCYFEYYYELNIPVPIH